MGELHRAVSGCGPLVGGYLAAEERREWALAAVRPTVRRPGIRLDLAGTRRWLGTRLVAVGQRLQGAHPVGQAIGSPAAAVEPGTAS